jgi:hypothetical protein
MGSMDDVDAPPASELLAAARRGDSAAFERLVASYRGELYAHCYRMLGSVQDAEDALQESLLGAWRGMAGFEGRSSLRAWLYRVATNACLRLIARRPRRMLSLDHGTLWNDLLANELVDELHLMIGPVVVGAGTPIFDGRPAGSLRLIDLRSWDGSENVLVRYEVGRSEV